MKKWKEQTETAYREYQRLSKKLEESRLDEQEQKRELSLAQFEVGEIEEAGLSDGEDEELEQTYRRMLDGKRITEGIAEAYRYTSEDSSSNASDLLSRAIRALQDVAE